MQTSSLPLFCRREALPLYMGKLRLAFRPIGRAHQTLPETHRSQTLQMCRLQPLLLTLRPPGPAHEAPPELTDILIYIQNIHFHTHKYYSIHTRDSPPQPNSIKGIMTRYSSKIIPVDLRLFWFSYKCHYWCLQVGIISLLLHLQTYAGWFLFSE